MTWICKKHKDDELRMDCWGCIKAHGLNDTTFRGKDLKFVEWKPELVM